jgi:hypothetical protein
MKRTHEAACAEKVRKASSQSTLTDDLLAVGPGIVCIGELRGFDESEWTLDLKHFLVGDVSALIQFVDTFPRVGREDRFILVNSIGDGRALTSAPAVSKSETGYLVRCPVAPRSPRTMAQQLGSQWAISRATNDLFVEKGQIARVSGLASLPQIIRSCLSIQRGESPFHPNFGARFAEYFAAFRDSPWLGQLLKLEVIRQSAIPYNDDVMKRQYTPFHCVDRVWSVEILAEAPTKNRLPTRFELEVNGVGRWQCDVSIFLSSERPAAAVKIR